MYVRGSEAEREIEVCKTFWARDEVIVGRAHVQSLLICSAVYTIDR